MQYFEHCLSEEEGGNRKQLEALLGRAKIFEKGKKFEQALEALSEACICFPDFQPAQIEKVKVHILHGEWENTFEVLHATMQFDKTNPEVLRIHVFWLMARENDLEHVLEKFDDLTAALKLNEGKNADLFYNVSRLFARYCGRKPEIIKKTRLLLETSIMLQPENVAYHVEIGHQQCMLGDYQGGY